MNRQQSLKEFYKSDQSGSSQDDYDEELWEPEENIEGKKKRGRPAEPLKWTRVFKINRDAAQEIEIYELDKDNTKFLQQHDPNIPSENAGWVPIFSPKNFEKEQNNFRCDDFKLNDEELIEYAKQVTKIRLNLLEKANKLKVDESEDQLCEKDKQIKEPEKYRRPYSCAKDKNFSAENEALQALKYHAINPKKRHLKQLSNSQMLDVAHDSLIKLQSNEQVSTSYNISEASVSKLIEKLKKNSQYLIEKQKKEEHSNEIDHLIEKTTLDYLDSGKHIWRTSIIQYMLKENHDVEVSLNRIKRIFKDKMQMRFSKIKRIAFRGNQQRCLVMRHLYGRKMIDLMNQGKTIWNFDQSFINESNFARKKWGRKGQQNSIPNQSVTPRIAVFLAMNNHGDAYLSLSQSNTDSDRTILFFHYFFRKLDLAQPDWRENSILLIDGAPYHHSDEITNYLKRNNVALFIAAPYAYDAAPCEMFFSYFKSKDLNPEHLKTGKRQVKISILIKSDLLRMQQRL